MKALGLTDQADLFAARPSRSRTVYRAVAVVAWVMAASILVLHYGFVLPTGVENLLVWLEMVLVFLFALSLIPELVFARHPKEAVRSHILEIILLAVLVTEFSYACLESSSFRLGEIRSIFSAETYPVSLHVYLLAVLATRAILVGRGLLPRLLLMPFSLAASVATSFLLVIFLGTMALLLPRATHGTFSPNISLVDALFTSTSAVCVTGLVVVDTATGFSRFGQSIIMTLIQLGGLGIMTYAGIFALAVGGGAGIRSRAVLQELLSTEGLTRVISLLKAILLTTLACELAGAVVLYAGFRDAFTSQKETLFTALFHSISAFCNAGFSTFSNSLEDFAPFPLIVLPVAVLIVCGGIGFSVVYEIGVWIKKRVVDRDSASRLSLHTRLVLKVTGILILLGFVVVLLGGDWTEANPSRVILASLFQSVTTRTAGFNTLPLGLLAPWCLVFFMVLMFIGGGSGGTAGGIKVSTVGLLYHSTKALIRGRSRVEIMHRTLSEQIVYTAFVISGLAAAYVACAVVALTWAEPGLPFFDLVFEVFSAFGTVGLSLGVTPKLSVLGKLIIILTMYVGRIGPLTVFLAMSGRRDEALYTYPSDTVVVG